MKHKPGCWRGQNPEDDCQCGAIYDEARDLRAQLQAMTKRAEEAEKAEQIAARAANDAWAASAAADTALQAERARREEAEQFGRDRVAIYNEDVVAAVVQLDAARAEAARLKEALAEIAAGRLDFEGDDGFHERARTVAYAALASSEAPAAQGASEEEPPGPIEPTCRACGCWLGICRGMARMDLRCCKDCDHAAPAKEAAPRECGVPVFSRNARCQLPWGHPSPHKHEESAAPRAGDGESDE